MKILPLFIAALCFMQGASHAVTNLLGNGDFASGQLAPWTAIGTATVANGVCTLNNASITQTIPTVAGARYYLSVLPNTGIGGGAVTFSATPAAGGTADGTRTINFAYGPTALIFTASSASTAITVAGTVTPGGFGSVPSVDNILLATLPRSRFLGSYTGSQITGLVSTTPALRQGASKHVVARIGEDGRVVIFIDATTIQTGRIFNDGTFELAPLPNTSVTISGTARVTPNHLDVLGVTADEIGQDDTGATITGKTSLRYLLTRTGP